MKFSVPVPMSVKIKIDHTRQKIYFWKSPTNNNTRNQNNIIFGFFGRTFYRKIRTNKCPFFF